MGQKEKENALADPKILDLQVIRCLYFRWITAPKNCNIITKAGKKDRQQIPDRAMPLSLSSFCPLLGISTGVLCAKTNRSDQQKILHNSSYYLSAFKKMFKFKGHKTAKLHPVLLLQISSMVWAEVAANSIPILSY